MTIEMLSATGKLKPQSVWLLVRSKMAAKRQTDSYSMVPHLSHTAPGEDGKTTSATGQQTSPHQPQEVAPSCGAFKYSKQLLDGRDITQTSLATVRRQMALADGNTAFFRRTVANNIAYGSWEARADDIITAAKEAGAHDFITALPEGYATVLDEHVKLTPSQRLRLSLARAVLRDAPILLVENLRKVEDDDAEALVEGALRRACLGRTCILACQQPQCAAVRAAQWVCVMRAGAIAEQGPVAFLAASRSLYRRLCYSSNVD